jgi:hypothetical protein
MGRKFVLKKRHRSGREETIYEADTLGEIGRFAVEKAYGFGANLDNRGVFDEFF